MVIRGRDPSMACPLAFIYALTSEASDLESGLTGQKGLVSDAVEIQVLVLIAILSVDGVSITVRNPFSICNNTAHPSTGTGFAFIVPRLTIGLL